MKKYIITIAIGILLTVSGLIIYMYNSTLDWKHTKLAGHYANIPAEFVKNNISADMTEDITQLSHINETLKRMEKENDINEATYNLAKKDIEKAKPLLEKYKIKGGQLLTDTVRLQLYIKYFEVMDKAYDEPNSKVLAIMTSQLSEEVIVHNRPLDLKLLKKCQQVIQDYIALNDFVDNTLSQFGRIDSIILLKNTIVKEDTQKLRDVIKNSNLNKFPKIKDLLELTESKQWSLAIDDNISLQEQLKWLRAENILKEMKKATYKDTSMLKTYADTISNHIEVNNVETNNQFDINLDSPIVAIFAGDTQIQRGMYVNETLPITVEIEPRYKISDNKPTSIPQPKEVTSQVKEITSTSILEDTIEVKTEEVTTHITTESKPKDNEVIIYEYR